ncbi:hypothetical protein RclHR1_02230018 [Rhizophagus clarus]|uniref:Uncharacterized protein n=1 Tax=Rhizophagus clarus TaxID=94130 RepID=A0A2Z6QYW5_9GLOM|nr:hypothetical protein RclHR1_02230018 [Rhizophagus clarus]
MYFKDIFEGSDKTRLYLKIQTFHFEGGLPSQRWISKRNFKGLEFYGTSIVFFKILSEWDMGLQSLRLSRRIIDRISKLQLLNTSGLNLQISVSKHNFKGPRFATLQSPYGCNFKGPQFSDWLLDGISKSN